MRQKQPDIATRSVARVVAMARKTRRFCVRTRNGAWGAVGRVLAFAYRNKQMLVRAGMGSGALLVVAGIVYYSVPASADAKSRKVAVNEPMEVAFSHPVHSARYKVSPAITGSWHVSKNFMGAITAVTFEPASALKPNTTYNVTLSGIRPLLGVAEATKTVSFTADKLEHVRLVSPAATNVLVQSNVVVAMAAPNRGVRRLVVQSSDAPLVSTNPKSIDDRRFTWQFAHELKQGTVYHLVLTDLNRPAGQQLLQAIAFTTVSEPKIAAATTTDHLYPNQPITVAFDQLMEQSSKAVTFSCVGVGKWQDAKTYTFTPATLPAGTACPYTVHKGARSTVGGVIETDQQFNVSSPGAAYVVSAAPSGAGIALSKGISVTFDQPVDHKSAQSAFSMSPALPGTFSWADNTMSFKPATLDYQMTYQIGLKAGVVAVYGLPSTQALSVSFATLPQTIKLNVPGYRQQYALSCEEASLRMALAYRGIGVSDMDVLQAVGYDPQSRNTSTTPNVWQDPNQMFVGDKDGKEGVTGWGAYGQPIAIAAHVLGGSAAFVAGITPQRISAAIHDNDPVVVWGVVSGQSPRIDSWNTDDGDGLVTVADNAHVRTVYGVVGSASNPLGFYLHDPLIGDVYWTTAQLQANMTANGQLPTQGVIVF